jgi:hypothetical protein
VTRVESEAAVEARPGPLPAPTPERDHWLVSDPLRTGFLLVLVLTMAVRFNILRDSYFITDDFMLMSRAAESPLGWDYLTRVHTGHFEPVGFGVMWVLAHVAPWNWGAAMTLLLAGQLVVAVLVWRLLVELFGRRPLTLVPFGLYCLTPLTAPATTWLSAAIIWLPLMAAVAGGTLQHVRYVRSGHLRHAVGAVLWLLLGFLSFEKVLILLPYLVVLTFAVQPQARFTARSIARLAQRTWVVWAGYAVAATAYLVVYASSARQSEGSERLVAPSPGQLWDFTYLSIFRTFVPASLGGPWSWQPISYAGALVDSPRVFDWACWIAAAAMVTASLACRRHMSRHWLSLLTYLAGSMAALAAGRVAFGGSIVALETRYLADAAIPLVVAIGTALMPLRGEPEPWMPVVARLRRSLSATAVAGALAAVLVTVSALSLHAVNAYAARSAENPHRPFVESVRASLKSLPDGAEIYDTALPVDIVGPIFEEYNLVSRFVAPVLSEKERERVYTQREFTRPYYLDPTGRFQQMAVVGAESPTLPEGSCGWNARAGQVAIPLDSRAFPWQWAVRIGYLADKDTTARVVLGQAEQEVHLDEGLGEVFVTLVGGGNSVEIQGLDPAAHVCVGDVQVGNPAPK